MTELMDLEGPWSKAAIEMALGEALATETKRRRDAHEAVLTGIGAAFSKGEGTTSYLKAIQKTLDAVQDGRRRARGIQVQERPNEAIEQLRSDLRGGGKRRKK